ncbi:MAG: carboxypeptidase regulatory-like domain-containing protein, partial [Chloroflexia bacterium]
MRGKTRWSLLVIALLFLTLPALPARSNAAEAGPAQPAPAAVSPSGPYIGGPVHPYVWNGDLRNLPQLEEGFPPPREVPPPRIPGKVPATPESWVDPVAQTQAGRGKMPEPLIHFAGLNMTEAGGWHPPDTNGDVGPNHYIQVVNIAIGIFDKATGTPLVKISYDNFFQGPPGSPCDNQNRGDVVALYDAMADRWIITDFALPSGESHECIAVSQSGDPISGGWYFYDLDTEDPVYGSWCDYPKLGVWPDAYYLSCNMFNPWIGAKVWALDRAAMLNGQPMNWVSFNAGSQYASLLPSNMKGAPPPAGSPNYFLSFDFPNTLHLWEFHVDWANPGNSTFTGPVDLTVADAGYIGEIPQPPPGNPLDSLGDRLMFSLHYRNRGSYESLWVNHTVLSNGVAGIRWYEVRDPGGTPFVYQQGTFQPDQHYRWMGSVATDQDGNMAVGYSIASTSMYPSIRYAGRLNGEVPGLLLQGEALMVQGGGSQIGYASDRWGDYSLMTVDPTDDCTFWYTQEYMEATGNAWSTRIGAFRFPSCGQPKGWLEGIVYDAYSLAPIPGVSVVAAGPTMTMTVESDGSGRYRMPLLGDTYVLTAGPLPPAYPTATVIPGVTITVGTTTTVNIPLVPMPHLETGATLVDDNVPGGNNNGYPEPGETGLLLYVAISNTGATTATGIAAHLTSLSPGLSIEAADAAYPDIGPAGTAFNTTAFVFSIAPTVPCGAALDFLLVATADQGAFTDTFRLEAKVPLPIAHIFYDDMESGPGNWTTGGQNNRWQITTEQSHSPSHAWSDSPYGDYWNSTNAWLRSPFLNLSGISGIVLTFWHAYDLEPGWDYGYVEYSTNGGATWLPFPENYTGYDHPWEQRTLDASVLDGSSNAAFRFRIQSDTSVTADGWYIDDVDLYYQPFECTYPVEAPGVPVLLSPPDGTVTSTRALTLTWEAGVGGAPEGYNLELDGVVYTTTETFSATVLASGLHTWRVRAYNALGYSAYSDPWTVEVLDLPGVPVLLS